MVNASCRWVLDLTPALQEAASEGPVLLIDDTHWSAAGNRAAVEALGRYLDSRAGRTR